ncbi:hypothetical protein Clacol_002856 [Clathrus columnatus]|uniref:HTH APSES-type domain-containing protein n=1 Tax=Clathrus columnatus TaxID=1419009 RepID=A0AAV5A590_9AGAM|nr:hypothetical protein Clacol_002856 [Clathrus columnatus]
MQTVSSSLALGLPQPQDEQQSTQSHSNAPRFYPFMSSKHSVTKNRYITSTDPRGYIPVYEYPLNGHWLMVDSDNGYVLWTGIWKALGNSKADIVKIVEGQPELASQLRRVRGGYLKIQGTWMPYEIALGLARRVAWTIREDLIPLFGPTFPSTCLAPDQPGFGQLLNTSPTTRRRTRRTMSHSGSVVTMPLEPGDSNNNNINSERLSSFTVSGTATLPRDHTETTGRTAEHLRNNLHLQLLPALSPPPPLPHLIPGGWQESGPLTAPSSSSSSTIRPQVIPLTPRYSPYPAGERPFLTSSNFQQTTATYYDDNNSGGDLVENVGSNLRSPPPGSILLPPIPATFHRANNSIISTSTFGQQQQDYSSPNRWSRNSNNGSFNSNLNDRRPIAAVGAALLNIQPYSLPPISALDSPGPGAGAEEGFNVLRRLRMDDSGLERNYYYNNNNNSGQTSHDSNNSTSSSTGGRTNTTTSSHRSRSPVNPSFQQPCDPARLVVTEDKTESHAHQGKAQVNSVYLPYPHGHT